MDKKKHIIILGGGQAAAFAAKEIRLIDSHSHLTLISEESSLPYERPPLSKDCLLEKMNFEQCLFFSNEFYKKNNIKVINNEKISKVDFKKNEIISINKNQYHYDKLLIATGSKNKKLNINKLMQDIDKEIIYLRNINDSQKIKKKLKLAKK